ncbi:MAG: nucleotide exchange factor GrpE, partial [bacterium]|nr:nucleotide exchange factor GrpE [bacterium]
MIETEQRAQNEEETLTREDNFNQLQRLKADFANYKRRMEQEHEEQTRMANEELIKKLLPVLDDFGRALASMPDESSSKEWGKGMRMVEHNLNSILEKEGLSKIEAKDQEFDPSEHEAVFTEEGKPEEQGNVKEIVSDGYRLHHKVIRPTQVSVIKGVKSESQPVATKSIPIRRGGDVRWK